jgi:hypothetical protein
MTQKQEIIQEKSRAFRSALVSFFLALIFSSCTGILIRYPLQKDYVLSLVGGCTVSIACFVACQLYLCNAFYLKGFLVHMRDDDPPPARRFSPNVFSFTRKHSTMVH